MREQPKYFESKFYDKEKDVLNSKAPKELIDEYEDYHKDLKEGKGKDEVLIVR